MNWKRWKLGLAVAGITGLLTTLVTAGIVPTMTWREFLLVMVIGTAKDVLLYLKQHPAEAALEANGELKQ